ncbi:MAG: hypothetical protein PGN25_08440 [Methylorubrum populi]
MSEKTMLSWPQVSWSRKTAPLPKHLLPRSSRGYEEIRSLEDGGRRIPFDFVKPAEVRSLLFLAECCGLDDEL